MRIGATEGLEFDITSEPEETRELPYEQTIRLGGKPNLTRKVQLVVGTPLNELYFTLETQPRDADYEDIHTFIIVCSPKALEEVRNTGYSGDRINNSIKVHWYTHERAREHLI